MDRPQCFEGSVYRRLHRLGIAYICSKSDRSVSEFIGGCLGEFLIEVHQGDPAASVDQFPGGRLSEPGGTAGDEGDLIFDVHYAASFAEKKAQ